MKFSVLLPTRNRLTYLRYAVESVLRQDYENWEVIVSDNHSEDDVAGYVASLNDARIHYFRTQEFVSVTDNWNNAIKKSNGDYIVMLGDDDCLTPGYFSAIKQRIEEYGDPDFIYTGAYFYAYPGVMPEHPEGYLQPYTYVSFLINEKEPKTVPFLVEKSQALDLVNGTMNFKLRYGFNMQYTMINRKFIEALSHKGPFFQSPFPDFYATNVMFLTAKKILADPRPLMIIGASPKSYSFYYANKRETEGVSFLKGSSSSQVARRLKRILLPGTHIHTGWLAAIETIRSNFTELDLSVNYWRYRLLQTVHVFNGYRAHKVVSRSDYREILRKLRFQEKLIYGGGFLLYKLLKKLLPTRWHTTTVDKWRADVLGELMPSELWSPELVVGRYKNIIEVFNDLELQK